MIKTKRDIELLNFLGDYGMLSTKLIANLFFTGVDIRTVLRRLRILEENKLIRSAGKLEVNNEHLWLATEMTGNFLGKNFIKLYCSKANLNHDYELSILRLKLEELGLINNWISEHQIKGHIFSKYKMKEAKDKHVPDAIIDSEVQSYKVACAVELELTLKNKDRYKKILNHYLYKDDLHVVWYIVPTNSLLTSLKEIFKKERMYSAKVKIFFTLLTDLKTFGENAKMIGLDSTYLIKNYFSNVKAHAHSDAHKVSMSNDQNESLETNLTSKYHTPFFGVPN